MTTALELTLGVDPGKTGALALLRPDGTIHDLIDMPDATGAALGALVRSHLEDHQPHRIAVAWVEYQTGMPGQSSSSTAKFHRDYGAVLGALGALGIPVHEVTPGVWKKAQRCTKDKNLSRQRAVELWPGDAGRFARAKDDGRAEAALVAKHGQEQTR